MKPHFKDEILDELARSYNVAQFVSFGTDSKQRYSRVLGVSPNQKFISAHEAIEAVLRRSSDFAVNVRSFEPFNPRSREFIRNLNNVDEIVEHVFRLSAAGLTTIVNEAVDVADGGVSGVATPQTLEFAPDATPRVVEEEGVARLPREWGDKLLETVYGFKPETPTGENLRIEFSIHPKPRGWLARHTILWEKEILDEPLIPARATWPNRFSSLVGDKVYGLLLAWLAGLPVPRTTVVGRRLAPFSFGEDTGEFEIWLRTAPAERTPGHFTTARGWIDPFKLLHEEDPENRRIASVLAQRAVLPIYSGAAITEANGNLRVEGVKGNGAEFMLTGSGETLPTGVVEAVHQLNREASASFGPVSFEWVFDGRRVWIVQLHVGRSASQGDVIYPGEVPSWIEVAASESLDRLRQIVGSLDPSQTGVVLVGSIGTSSHKGDFLRKEKVPSRLRAK
ncbi:hypothetical protein [Bradyrhizobium liaoningense]|uniref:hypothetical protein n=1 Tax=Bradyrhizobium liaoningense TaxID=43992 RepID=UPI001BA7A697|nr:hypothetical protein [Bradyrhizobium liaoningense]MBR0941582.1 hypothetical protein [Bradyrhizobium liaoningense]